jgi:SAM-dependent methyltransferase
MSQETLPSYDETPYPGDAIAETHPDLLGTVGRLRGLPTCAPTAARVLELGCGDGGNLISLAVALPESHFLGIDLSQRQIEDGRRNIAALGLANIELRHCGITDMSESPGTVDYILCHGVYSWVPAEVQTAILKACAHCLQPSGVAYISYNTLPGWRTAQLLRDMMVYHLRPFTGHAERLKHAREFLSFLGDTLGPDDSPHAALLKTDLEILRQLPDWYLLHEHLDEDNHPVYFFQFIEQARAHGLEYLSEARLSAATASNFRPEVEEQLRGFVRDVDQLEQTIDLLRNRPFRQTLLCRAGAPLSPTLSPDAVTGMFASSAARQVSGEGTDLAGPAPVAFRGPEGLTLTTSDPMLKLALGTLSEVWPEAMAFDRLATDIEGRLGPLPADWRRHLAIQLLKCHLRNLVELHVSAPRLVRRAGAFPVGSPWARLQATRSARVADLRHRPVELEDFDRLILTRLDGRQDREGLVRLLNTLVEQGKLQVKKSDAAGDADKDLLAEAVERSLQRLGENALLLA